MDSLQVGDLIYGYCGGIWGNEGLVFHERRVEAIGADWVVVRNSGGNVEMFYGSPADLQDWTT